MQIPIEVQIIEHIMQSYFYIATVDEVNEQIAIAEEFIQMVEEYCKQHLDEIPE
jgi:uncharacterized protein YnzC (UPF0291/DUF896 family)